MVLGERNLFVFRSNGTMYFQKKFDFKAICCHSYVTVDEQAISSNGRPAAVKHSTDQQQSQLERDLVTLLITEMSTLHIYKSRQLKWSSQLPQSYCHVQRANFRFTPNCELIGCLTFLASDGRLALAFLGTNPSMNIVNNVQSSLTNRRSSQRSGRPTKQSTFSNEELFTNTQMDKEEFDKEMLELRKIINAYNSDFNSLIKLNAGQDGKTSAEENDLTVELASCKFDTTQDGFRQPIKLDNKANNVIDLEFGLSSNKPLSNLIVALNTSNCFNITPNLHNLPKLESTNSSVQFRLFYDSLSKLISYRSNQIFLVVNYFNEKNLPRVFSKLVELPMTFFCRLQNQSGLGHSRTGSSTNTSHNSSASQRSSAPERGANQSLLSKTLEASLDQYLLEADPSRQPNNTIAFQFASKRSISLSGLLQEIISRNSLGKLIKKVQDEDSLKTNKLTVQFINSKLKLVHVEFVGMNEDSERFENKIENERPANDKLTTYRVAIMGDDLHSNSIVFNILMAKLNSLCLVDRTIERIQFGRSSLPTREYFELINLHLRLRQSISTKKQQLEEHCERLRVIEKRILLKLKDRNISNLANLESLLNVQHQKVSATLIK